jgi:hypothetical protein
VHGVNWRDLPDEGNSEGASLQSANCRRPGTGGAFANKTRFLIADSNKTTTLTECTLDEVMLWEIG